MVGYVLRPSPGKGYVGAAIAAFGSSCAARGGGVVRFRAVGHGHWPALPVVRWWQISALAVRRLSGYQSHHCASPVLASYKLEGASFR